MRASRFFLLFLQATDILNKDSKAYRKTITLFEIGTFQKPWRRWAGCCCAFSGCLCHSSQGRLSFLAVAGVPSPPVPSPWLPLTWRGAEALPLGGRGLASGWTDRSTVAHEVTVKQNGNVFPNGLLHSCVHWFNLCKALYCLWGLWVQFYAWLKRLLIAAIFVFKDLQRIKRSILEQWAIIN